MASQIACTRRVSGLAPLFVPTGVQATGTCEKSRKLAASAPEASGLPAAFSKRAPPVRILEPDGR